MWSSYEFSSGLSSFYPQVRRSLSRAAELLTVSPGLSYSRALGNSFRQTVSRILRHKDMNQETMLAGHQVATLERCVEAAGHRIIIAQDSVYFNYTGHKAMEGLGEIQAGVKGLVQHNALAMDEHGLPLGVVYLRSWTRGEASAPEKESEKWIDCLESVGVQVRDLDRQFVLVQDREADFWDFFKAPRPANLDLVVRLFQARKFEQVGDPTILKLKQTTEALPVLGIQEVTIRRNNQEQTLSLSIQAAAVNVLPRKDLSSRLHKTQGLSMVIATEVAARNHKNQDCFDPQNRAQWILLTSLETQTLAQAAEVVRIYALRWGVERFHFTYKSGALQVESLQLDDLHALKNALALYAILAWRIMFLTHAVRKDPQQPARQFFTPEEIRVLKAYHPQADQDLGQAIRALGKIIRFVPTKKQPYPGVKLMAEAIQTLNQMTEFLQKIE